mmetsp:Transcript_27476/g.68301  ORF Transcript_27476/g.68301 Transcript_27476/m.68301 type:complete len:437 (+) Transcript_27476:108-1418(+)
MLGISIVHGPLDGDLQIRPRVEQDRLNIRQHLATSSACASMVRPPPAPTNPSYASSCVHTQLLHSSNTTQVTSVSLLHFKSCHLIPCRGEHLGVRCVHLPATLGSRDDARPRRLREDRRVVHAEKKVVVLPQLLRHERVHQLDVLVRHSRRSRRAVRMPSASGHVARRRPPRARELDWSIGWPRLLPRLRRALLRLVQLGDERIHHRAFVRRVARRATRRLHEAIASAHAAPRGRRKLRLLPRRRFLEAEVIVLQRQRTRLAPPSATGRRFVVRRRRAAPHPALSLQLWRPHLLRARRGDAEDLEQVVAVAAHKLTLRDHALLAVLDGVCAGRGLLLQGLHARLRRARRPRPPRRRRVARQVGGDVCHHGDRRLHVHWRVRCTEGGVGGGARRYRVHVRRHRRHLVMRACGLVPCALPGRGGLLDLGQRGGFVIDG